MSYPAWIDDLTEELGTSRRGAPQSCLQRRSGHSRGVAQPLQGAWMVPSKRPGPAGRTADPGLSGCETRDRTARFTVDGQVWKSSVAARRTPTET